MFRSGNFSQHRRSRFGLRLPAAAKAGKRHEGRSENDAGGAGLWNSPTIAHDAQSKILNIDGVDETQVALVWDPAWNQRDP
jgi:hypothetical protein